MDGGLTAFILENFEQQDIMILVLFALIVNYFLDIKMMADIRHFKLESRLEDAKLRAEHDIDIQRIEGRINTWYHQILEKISDNGTLFEQRLKEHGEVIITAIAEMK